ncbi:unnamed protein product, partial [Amoebophrya sp. A25]|eukprot:GSA25T00012840001.1
MSKLQGGFLGGDDGGAAGEEEGKNAKVLEQQDEEGQEAEVAESPSSPEAEDAVVNANEDDDDHPLSKEQQEQNKLLLEKIKIKDNQRLLESKFKAQYEAAAAQVGLTAENEFFLRKIEQMEKQMENEDALSKLDASLDEQLLSSLPALEREALRKFRLREEEFEWKRKHGGMQQLNGYGEQENRIYQGDRSKTTQVGGKQ